MKQIKNETILSRNLTLKDALGKEFSVEQAISLIQADEVTYRKYLSFPEAVQKDILGFIVGQHGLKITYDSFFQSILSPHLHPRRIESLLSAIFEDEVHIKEVLPREGNQMAEDGSLIIMDILLQLSNNTYINVEMQKYGYLFPGERSDCYAADFIMRQYNKLKDEKKDHFSYKDMKPFYIIVLMANSSSAFLKVAPAYIHNEITTYDSGARVTSLSHIKYISLDTFHKSVHNITNKLDAWLTFLSSDKPEDIISLINAYPEFMELYQDISTFRTKPKELIHMYSEALAIADRNTVKLMIDEMKEQLNELTNEKDTVLKELNSAIKEKDCAIKEKDSAIREKDSAIREKNRVLKENESLQRQIEELKAQCAKSK